MNTLNTLNTTTVTRREIAQRCTSFGLAVVMTLGLLGTVNLLAVEPSADSLLAQHTPLVAAAPAQNPAS